MIKCNVTVCGTISKAAVVRTNNENKAEADPKGQLLCL